ncbi:hypothetical protein SODALDRAFT_353713 [Sodiomyces alkalinus F11]|uniref:Uncharacterized protein n=1 Tax=Sodiomyces alkalinus (strain CBS 110278 / VKM F-3762 / F11) TaxID=1314773 RepID=A0A3N2PJN0_SODAK|nr:hypothetical protein SODALDRAFT_353713 [Sodiomyces alkalinus F11]ROT34738.1 hypothetical protein SODALDRAFT_353713 [Sodiomyces alkalinus F11]
MFGSTRRKKRQPAQPLTAATVNASAATAAAAAFGRRDSMSSLSSAAAAAALRSRPITPTNVADVQTRRTMRRSASVSSQHSYPDTRPADLHRSPSQSSMSGRTFRSPSPSPHRTSSPATPVAPDAPPVPSIPDNMRTASAAAGTRRKAPPPNLHTQPFHVASQKSNNGEGGATGGGGGGSWFGAASEGDLANVRRSNAALQQAQQQLPAAESRSGAVGTPPPASPVVAERNPSVTQDQQSVSSRRSNSVASRQSSSSAAPDQGLVYDPNSRRMVPRPDLRAMEMSVRAASEKPVKRHKSQSSLSRSGSHLSKGTVARTSGTLVEPATPPSNQPLPSSSAEPQDSSRPHPPSLENGSVSAPKAPAEEKPINGEARPQETQPNHLSSSGPTASSQPAPISHKQDPEPLSHAEKPPCAVPVQVEEPTTSKGNLNLEEKEVEEGHVTPSAPLAPAGVVSASEAVDSVPVKSSPPLARVASVDRRCARPGSISPVRNARFSLTNDQLVVKHEPPPRSVSPRKSAMKNSTSPSRGASPSDEGSEMSADVANRFEDQPMSRKKSVRVSFNDENTQIIGEEGSETRADHSPVARSPQQANRWSWTSSRPRTMDANAVPILDDDEIMKPRPALPSFGSIRDKKHRDTGEERPLVRPHAPGHSSPGSGSGMTTMLHPSSDHEDVEEPTGQSSDYNIGSVLQQEHVSSRRNEPSQSKCQDPLPPVVTSLEGNGYYSASSTEDELDSESQDESEPGIENHAAQVPALTPIQEVPHESNLTSLPEQGKKDADLSRDVHGPRGSAKPSLQPIVHHGHEGRQQSRPSIPSIAIIEPSPGVVAAAEGSDGDETKHRDPAGYFEVPGSFPQDDAQRNASNPNTNAKAPNGIHPGPNQPNHVVASNTGPHVSFATITKKADPDSDSDSDSEHNSSNDSIYSDAYEDLSDVDEGGFMSLDAIVTTPVSSEKVSRKLFEEALAISPSNKEAPRDEIASARSELLPKSPGPRTPVPEPLETPTTDEDWEKAKAYWRSLSSEKRKQLEQEALGDALGDPASQADHKAVDQARTRATEKEGDQGSVSGTQQQTERKPAAVGPRRMYQIAPGTKVPDSPDEPPSHMRKTLRAAVELQEQTNGHAGGGLRTSMRGEAGAKKASTAKAPRPVSVPQAPVSRDTSIKHKRQISLDTPASSAALAAGTGAAMRPSLRRRGSDSSESSFKRARAQRQRQGLGFRRSMRTASPERGVDAQRSSRFSLRSISPPASPPPGAGGHRMGMRSTLRGDASDESGHRMRVPTFGRRSGKKAAEKHKKSRFDDSSDEEDVVRRSSTAFRSRFDVDSSDDEGGVRPRAASGTMPKSLRHRASTARATRNGKGTTAPEDLLHSSDDEEDVTIPRRTASGRTLRSQTDRHAPKHKRSGRGELAVGVAAASASASPLAAGGAEQDAPPPHRGSGFFSVLRRRKDGSSGKISRPEPRESAARQDTKLERSADEISNLRHGGSLRLQKNRGANNWPLLDDVAEEKRPATAGAEVPAAAPAPAAAAAAAADAAAKESPRSIFSKRRSASHGILGLGLGHHHHHRHHEQRPPREQDTGTPDLDDQSQADGSVRKKKFGKLRKMFGLND